MNPSRDLEVQEDIPFQKRAWRVERVGWTIMVLLVICALVGLLGPGPLSKQVLWDGRAKVKAEFNQFDRYQSPTTIRLSVDASVISRKEFPVTINREFISEIELNHIDPEPERVETSGEDFRFYFAASTNETATIVFHFEPNRFGTMPVRFSVGDRHQLNFEQFYFP